MTRIEVDFNSRDDAGYVDAPIADADGPSRVGDHVQTYDDQGNRCLAIVARVTATRIGLDPLWQTFAAPSESRLVVVSPPGMWAVWKNGLTLSLQPTTLGLRGGAAYERHTTAGPLVPA